MYQDPYIPIFLMLCVAITIAAIMIILPKLIRKLLSKTNVVKDTPAKLLPYECGFDQAANPAQTFDIRFYLFAVLFVLFDIEIIFLAPFALNLKAMPLYSFIAGMIFISILIIGLIYEFKTKALEI